MSATPERFRDEEGTKAILDFFENKLKPTYEIKDALGKSLVHYDYTFMNAYLVLRNVINGIKFLKKYPELGQ